MELERLALPPPGPGSLPLALLELGTCGRFQLIVGPPRGEGEPPQPPPEPRATLPQGLPPFAPPLVSELEGRFLGTPEWLPPHQGPGRDRQWERCPEPRGLFRADPTPPGGQLRAQRDPRTGALTQLREELVSGPLGQSWGGGLLWLGGQEQPHPPQPPPEEEEDVDFETELLTTPPGMLRGVDFRPPAPGGPLSLSGLLRTLEPLELGGPEGGGGDGSGGSPPPLETPQPSGGGRGSPEPPPLRRADSLEELLQKPSEEPPGPPPSEQGGEGQGGAVGEGPWALLEDAETPLLNFHELVPDPAFKWGFPLDPFQQRAILCLERGLSVLVSAHTSAGKTVVAEYALALSRRHLTRAIYTSPIKALSNQKFREFRETFGEVGLVTGEVQLRPQAPTLVMTTEILRSMLFNGSDILGDLEWVIFDEVHYINDPERGVVWEEALILLPPHVRLVLLSATVPNALQLAQWVGQTRRCPVHVLSCRRRPVPLRHFLFTGQQLHLLLDQGGFSTQGYYAAVEAKKEQSSKFSRSFGAKQPTLGGTSPGQERALWVSALRLLGERGLLPAVAFTLSRGRCEAQAAALGSLELLQAPERGRVRSFLQRCLGRLRPPDRRLPQVLQVSELLLRGIGIHHGGVLPLLKEMVEMLFSQGLLKVLFATETFAMGVNMPARTVLFDSIRKHDGNGCRDLLPSEYVQMSGRAGRRGLDSTGTVIILCKGPVPELSDLHRIMMGRPEGLQSQFRVSYRQLLLLLRGPALPLPHLLRCSFREFHRQQRAPALEREALELRRELAALGEGGEGQEGEGSDLPQYHQCVRELRQARARLMQQLLAQGGQRLLAPGRVVVVSGPRHRNALALLLQVSEGPSPTFQALVLSEKPPQGDPETPPDAPSPDELLLTRLFLPDGPPWGCLEQLRPEELGGITAKTLRLPPGLGGLLRDLRPHPGAPPPNAEVGGLLQELLRLAGGGGRPPMMDPILGGAGGGSPKLRLPEAVELAARARQLGTSLGSFRCPHHPSFALRYSQFERRWRLQQQLEQLQFQLSDQSLVLLPEAQQRMAVLRSLGYISPGGSLALGGRVAGGLSCRELLLTELLLGGVLSPLPPPEAVALLSCVVTPHPGDPPRGAPPSLLKALEQLRAAASRLGQLQEREGLPEGPQFELEQLGCGFMEVAYEWVRGTAFGAVVSGSGLQEGAVVRGLQRLQESCRELRSAAGVLGDPALAARMEAAATAIKRDIVFTPSLYTQ